MSFDVMCGFHKYKSWVMTSPTRRERLTFYAGDFVFLGMSGVMGNTIYPRIWNGIPGFVNICHRFSPSRGKRIRRQKSYAAPV